MSQIWNQFIIAPLSWILRELYALTGSYGGSILLFAVFAKIILFFFAFKGKKGMLKMQRLAPKQRELQAKYKGDTVKINTEMQKLYQEENVTPMSGCLWNMIPYPILLGLYAVVRQPLQNILRLTAETKNQVVDFVSAHAAEWGVNMPSNDYYKELVAAQQLHDHFDEIKNVVPEVAGITPIDFTFLHIFKLAEVPHLPWSGGFEWIFFIPFLSAAASLCSVLLTQKFAKTPPAPGAGKLMMYVMMPGMSLWFGFIMPAAMGIYWITQAPLNVVQEYFLTKHFNRVLDAEEAERSAFEARKKEAERRQKEEDRQRRAERIAAGQSNNKKKKYKLQKHNELTPSEKNLASSEDEDINNEP